MNTEAKKVHHDALERGEGMTDYLACLDCGVLLADCACPLPLPDCPCGGKPRVYVSGVPASYGIDCTICDLDTVPCEKESEAREDWRWLVGNCL